MAQMADGFTDGSATPARARRLRLAGPGSPAQAMAPATATTVTDEQIRALVGAARALADRQRARGGDSTTAAAEERLARLDWAARAGSRVLLERADRAGTSSGVSTGRGTGSRR